MAGCGSCSKPKPQGQQNAVQRPTMQGETMSFTLNLTGGEKMTFQGSRLEAQAALKRLGGGSLS